jgi:hypothetical protein
MAATYDATAIATDIISYARMRFHDVGRLSGTTVGAPLLLDEEYQGLITKLGAQEGLAQAAESLAASFAQKVQHYAESGGISIQWPSRPDFYAKLATSIRMHGVGGTSYGNAEAGNTDLPTPLNDPRLALLDEGPWIRTGPFELNIP